MTILKKLGFSDKAAAVYLTLLRLGPSSVRHLAEECGLNRGTTYDTLKWLQEEEVVSFYNKNTRQTFVAENPERLKELLGRREKIIAEAGRELSQALPELSALYNRGDERPVARYFEQHEIAHILADVLETCVTSGELLYRVYSTAGIREYLYADFPTFSDERVSRGIAVRALALGEGGELRGLDERKWLPQSGSSPTYIIIYPGKTAYIALTAQGKAMGVVIENRGVYETQRTIFDTVWSHI